MSLWPFKKQQPAAPVEAEEPAPQPDEDASLDFETPDPVHDAIDGENGPFDGDSVDVNSFDFQDFASGMLNLGSLSVPLPHKSEVQIEVGQQGPKMLHVLTEFGRITPVAFAAPQSAGQWRESTKEIAEGMRRDGLLVSVERGPWGREVVGTTTDGRGVVRVLGVDGPRWMLRFTIASPSEFRQQMAELAREVAARTFVYRGPDPILAGSPLPVVLPEGLAQRAQEEFQRRGQEQSKDTTA